MEGAALGVERLAAGGDARLAGVVRLTTIEPLAYSVVIPCLAELQKRHPELEVDLNTEVRSLDVARGQADIALRLTRPTASNLVCRKLGELGFTLYASHRYLAAHGRPERGQGLANHSLVSYLDTPSSLSPLFMGESLEGAFVALRSYGSLARMKAAADGLGICELACCIADENSAIERVWPDEKPLLRPVWMITHEDLRRSAKIRLVTSAVAAAFERVARFLRYGRRTERRSRSEYRLR